MRLIVLTDMFQPEEKCGRHVTGVLPEPLGR